MQKKLLLLGGIRYLLPMIKKAQARGIYVITADYLPHNFAHKYSDEYVNVSIIDKDAVLQIAREKHIDGIMSFACDPGVITAAYVAEQLGLPFQCSYETACILQNKSRFRQFLAENGFNCPRAKGYDDVETAIQEADFFTWPVIVKPVDSAGSKGVTKVTNKSCLREAIQIALNASISKHFIIEDFLDTVGYQSSADVFALNGDLAFPAYSDQIFDPQAANPYTPAIEVWPSSMPKMAQDDLNIQLVKLFKLLGIRNGLFNVESRLCSNGKAYLMEVSPRAGGNRIVELQCLASGQDLVEAELNQIMGVAVRNISTPFFDKVWCNYIIHSNNSGILKRVEIDPFFKQRFVRDEGYNIYPGDMVAPFIGANNSIGTLFLQTEKREEMDALLMNINKYVRIILE